MLEDSAKNAVVRTEQGQVVIILFKPNYVTECAYAMQDIDF